MERSFICYITVQDFHQYDMYSIILGHQVRTNSQKFQEILLMKINWKKKHVDSSSGQINRDIGVALHARIFLNSKTHITLFYSLMHPIFIHRNQIWINLRKITLHPLIILQKKYIELMHISRRLEYKDKFEYVKRPLLVNIIFFSIHQIQATFYKSKFHKPITPFCRRICLVLMFLS